MQAPQISGPIYIETNKLHPFGAKATAMHELGHMVGLYHDADPNSLMYPTCANYGLSQKDIDKINTIYPAASSKVETNEPAQTENSANSAKRILKDVIPASEQDRQL